MLSTNGDSSSYGLRLGAYFTTYLGLNLTYFDYGTVKNNYPAISPPINDQTSSRNLQMALVGNLPVGELFSIGARVGQGFHSSEIYYVVTDGSVRHFSESVDGSDPFFALYTSVRVFDRTGLGIEYQFN